MGENARVEFDKIARDKDFFAVICLYVDEQGKRMMTWSMCGKNIWSAWSRSKDTEG